MTLADCFFTIVLILAPLGANSQFEGMRLYGSACASSQLSTKINQFYELIVSTEWEIYVIPLPKTLDRIRLHYRMQDEFAYLGDCRFGLKPYYYATNESVCMRVMVKFGPKGTY